ncbi:NHL repeat-containing protein [Anaeromyxobacter terrae]|uniref:hypothetical protein n=1 Tax=Anaeromyxobacter terrae TaxID=2925406 RepID=UPI001F566538|nr:hypothetical protein [Anaeromyxobacter sp. SG22]
MARLSTAILAVFLATAAHADAPAELRTRYGYDLSSLSGRISSSWAALTYDTANRELFMVDRSQGIVHVFTDLGIETYSFGDESEIGPISGVVPLESGDLLVLASRSSSWTVWRCNFRGEPIAKLSIKGLPDAFAKDFAPSVLQRAAGRTYIADKGSMRVLVTDDQGTTVATYELKDLLKFDKRHKDDAMSGFNVDRDGSMLVTVAPMFQAFVVSPKGDVRAFGTHGSAPGKFNIVGGIATDEKGNYLVTDILRAVVMVFDREFQFLGEFGYRGDEPDNLVGPLDLVAANGKVFVAQSANRGVKVFRYE